jgi:DNA polymerase III alpha subunit
MINIKTRSEFSFREVYGPLDKLLDACKGKAVGLCDRNGTWGHVQFVKACEKAQKKPLLGVELAVVEDASIKEKLGVNWMSFLAANDKGLKEVYELVSQATDERNFYYQPRIDYSLLHDVSDNVIMLSGAFPIWGSLPRKKTLFVELSPMSPERALTFARDKKLPVVATSDNYYPAVGDRAVYEVLAGRNRQVRTAPMHILNEAEWRIIWPSVTQDAIQNQSVIADMCNAKLPKANLVHFENMPSLRSMCEKAAKSRGIDLKKKVYADRLKRELDLIAEKEFEDYFYLVTDIIKFAKEKMLVGPARGSSCGSLVCYLLSITEVDPIPYDLLFERFIDINRKDLPDIDIDFPDDRREMVFSYIENKFGKDCVARLGTIMRYKAKSTIADVAKELSIPAWEVSDLKGAIVERSTGDARAAFCILDTFEQLEIGKQTLSKYPQLRIAAQIENHARQSGQHAAGIVVTAEPISTYCSVDRRTGAVQVDKKDAETLNLLKIDALGLRTLAVIQDCLDQVGWSREKIIKYPTNDPEAFDVLNDKRFTGIFQFEGYALQSLCSQMRIENFEDIASMTALARPGPLESGGAAEFIKRRTGQHEAKSLHVSVDHITKITYGIVIYQEQVMQIAREMGQLSWEDVSSLRKAMSKSLGKEFFDQYWERFKVGAEKLGVSEQDAATVWHNINTMGSWSFNRSHAVAYAMVSYWTMVLKSKFPLEFSAACLRNARDEEQSIKLLRELKREGFDYKAYDPKLSEKNWTVKKGVLIGGLTNIKGIGEKMADDIIQRRIEGRELTNGQKTKLANGQTPFDSVFECEDRWGHIKKEPEKYNITSRISDISDISEESEGEFLIIGKLKEKDIRDMNDPNAVKKRNGRRVRGQSLTLNLVVEDDTGNIRVRIDRHKYIRLGLPIVEEGKMGEWYMWKGEVGGGYRSISLTRWRKLSGSEYDILSKTEVS